MSGTALACVLLPLSFAPMISRRQFTITSSAAVLAGFNTAQAQTSSKIILGQSAPFSGPAAQLGIQFHQGAKVWFDQVNAQGGVGGKSIELRKMDDGYEPERCVANTRKMISQWPAAQRERDDAQAQQWLDQVFAATPQRGSLHLVLRGTNFQIKVWEALLKVEPSRMVSYTQLAQLVGTPRAQRAVGSALAANTIGYLIPCHRVIRESGDFGRYRWGSERKTAMLAREAGQAGHEARPE